MSAAKLLSDLTRLRVRVQRHGDSLRYAPKTAITPDLAERMKANKCDLLALLTDEPVTQDDRQQAYASLIERVNAGYSGGVIDWPRSDAIEQRIWTATTTVELSHAIADYENTVLGQ